MSQSLITSRKFWVTTAAITSVSLIFYDWYSDRYALPSKRYSRIECDYEIPIKLLRKIRKAFVKDMTVGLTEDDHLHQNEKKSSLKMLSSHVRSIPDGTEKGVFYTLDWGGSNFRVLRIEFSGNKDSEPKTLLACAYDHENVRVGLILGTGSNACYIEPNPPIKHQNEKDNVGGGEIINIEWGNFEKLLPRMPTDFIMDEYTPNPGGQYAEKMINWG